MKRVGVIVAVDSRLSPEQATGMREQLDEMFPGVTFAVVSCSTGNLVFEYDDERSQL